ncbi:MAG: hypothetical protein EXS39_05930 [Opitutaceae bacterium]|nr:hypothetical protein [Opitutaceae bacterium]
MFETNEKIARPGENQALKPFQLRKVFWVVAAFQIIREQWTRPGGLRRGRKQRGDERAAAGRDSNN